MNEYPEGVIVADVLDGCGDCNLLEYLTQRDIQTKNSGVNVRYRGKHRFFKGFNEFIKEKTRRCDNDFEKIERHVFFDGVIHNFVDNKKDNRLEALVFSHL